MFRNSNISFDSLTTTGYYSIGTTTLSAVITGAQSRIYCEGTGHYYFGFWSDTAIYSFESALASASAMYHNFQPGYLATVTSQVEMDCVTAAMYPGNQWIGGVDYYSEGTFRWIDGPEAGLPITGFWGSNQPNGGTDENCVALVQPGLLHDFACTVLLQAILVEFDDDTRDSCMFLL
jgi:hypothetical protein